VKESQVDQWEYASAYTTAKPIAQQREHLIALANEWGEQGWELVQVISGIAYGRELGEYFVIFKRRKS
jgi:hypothetical protein